MAQAGAELAGGKVILYQGDCLDVLRTLPDQSVDAVVCDPPYGQTNEDYDGPIAFDPSVWRECFRVAKDNAALLSFAGSPTYHKIASAIEAGGWKVRQMWGWVYRDGLITSAYPKEGFDRLAPAMDPIVFATKGKVLLRLAREGDPWAMTSRPVCQLSTRSKGKNGALRANGHWPRTLVSDGCDDWEWFAASRAHRGLTDHPNEKPLALMRWLCGKLPPGIVLDPFAGSGTTLIAAMAEGHTGIIGIEKELAYFAIARNRLAPCREGA